MPRPAPVGTSTQPAWCRVGSVNTAIRIGCSDWSSSSSGGIALRPGGLSGSAAISCKDAAKATPVPHTCGLTRTPKAFAISAIFFAFGDPAGSADIGLQYVDRPLGEERAKTPAGELRLAPGDRDAKRGLHLLVALQ